GPPTMTTMATTAMSARTRRDMAEGSPVPRVRSTTPLGGAMQDVHAVTLGGRSLVTLMRKLHADDELMQTLHRRGRPGADDGHDMQDLHDGSAVEATRATRCAR